MDRSELSIVRFALILAVIVGASGMVLSFVYSVTAPRILKNEQAKEEESLRIIMPAGKGFSRTNDYYVIRDAEGATIGYVFRTEAKGYGGMMKCSVGIDTAGLITGIVIVSHKETPGLGTKVEEVRKGEAEPFFLARFKGKKESETDFKNIEAVSGATISSRAVLNAAKSAFARYNKIK